MFAVAGWEFAALIPKDVEPPITPEGQQQMQESKDEAASVEFLAEKQAFNEARDYYSEDLYEYNLDEMLHDDHVATDHVLVSAHPERVTSVIQVENEDVKEEDTHESEAELEAAEVDRSRDEGGKFAKKLSMRARNPFGGGAGTVVQCTTVPYPT